MSIFRKSLIAGAAFASMGFGAAANAVVIDLFTDPPAGQIVDTSPLTGGVSDYNQVGVYPATIIGGYRDLGITQLPGADAFQYAKATVSGGLLSVANDPTVRSTTVVTWDGANAAGVDGSAVKTNGLGGVDLASTASYFEALVKYADLGFNYSIQVWDMDGDWSKLSAGVQFAVPDGNTDVAQYLFSWFNLAAGTYCDGVASPPACANPLTQLDFSIARSGAAGNVDFSRIGAFQLVLENPSTISVDFQLGSITAVPEPSALALAGLGLIGAAAAGRRRKVSRS